MELARQGKIDLEEEVGILRLTMLHATCKIQFGSFISIQVYFVEFAFS